MELIELTEVVELAKTMEGVVVVAITDATTGTSTGVSKVPMEEMQVRAFVAGIVVGLGILDIEAITVVVVVVVVGLTATAPEEVVVATVKSLFSPVLLLLLVMRVSCSSSLEEVVLTCFLREALLILAEVWVLELLLVPTPVPVLAAIMLVVVLVIVFWIDDVVIVVVGTEVLEDGVNASSLLMDICLGEEVGRIVDEPRDADLLNSVDELGFSFSGSFSILSQGQTSSMLP